MKILFICLGNMCRSPLIEQMFSAYAEEHGLSCECDSAGLLDHVKPMSPNSCAVLLERGLRPRAHASKLISADDVLSCTYIFTMTDRLKDKVVEHFGNADKVVSLSDERLLGEEVEDPYGLDLDAYRKVAAQFERLIPKLSAFLGLK